MKEMMATLSLERELNDEFQWIEYEIGNGEVHFHSRIEICIVEEGSVEAFVNNAKRTLSKGDLSLALPYDSHCYVTKELSGYSVLLLPSELSEKFIMILNKSPSAHFLCGTAHNARVLDYLSHIKEGKSELTRLGYLHLLLGVIAEAELEAPAAEGIEAELLSELLLYIHKNYKKRLTLSSIASAFGYHPGYISAYFKDRLNVGISRYINVIRLKNAVLLMQKKKYTVTEVALECGFCSTRTFYRAFQREFGCSPKEYFE